MQAVIAGRGRRQGQRQGNRYVYTGSLDSEGDCNICRCCGVFCFGLSSIAALCGIMLTVFGSTGFFRTPDLNNAFVIVGVVLLVAALVLIAAGYTFSRRAPENQRPLSSNNTSRHEIP